MPGDTLRLSNDDHAMLEALEASADALVSRAVDWCAINSGSHNSAGLARVADALKPHLAALPGPLDRIALDDIVDIDPNGEPRARAGGEALRLIVRPSAPIQILLTGHYDTVFPAGSAFDRVVSRDDGALHGPGIADMKGGISVMLGALAAFERHPLADRLGYAVLLSPDEEIGSPASAPLLATMARRAQVGLTYEPAMSDGALAAARKGTGNFHLAVHGRAAHAGRDFALGRNAIAAAARAAAAIDALNGVRPDVTFNVARIDGGGALNTVPDVAVVRANVRFPDAAGGAWACEALSDAVRAADGEGLRTCLHGGLHRPAKPFNAAQQALFGAVRSVGALIGQSIAWAPSGGVCEGNNLFASGLPNVDTLGVRGGEIHSDREFAWPDSFVERAQLSALLLAKLAEGGVDAHAIRAAMTG